MRYYIYYPPTKSLKRVDVLANTRIEEIIGMVQNEFGLKIDGDSEDNTLIVLKYNGSDLKSTWSLADLNVPPGAIIHCLYRKKKSADLYIHCDFNNQILDLFDDTITMETTIGEIRKKISNRIGIPLSTFCLEMRSIERRRLYDQMKLFQCDLKLHDHISLKVWRGYENFLNSCMKGFPKQYSHDDLTRHYQLQIALHVAAFYGFMELGRSALQLGARSDCPVGEHPSRQWSSETTAKYMPEMLKCPIHVAIERGHMKMVDLFVQQSLLCTQVMHPISGFLPYRLALSLSVLSKIKMERQCYRYIYLYLFDKQFNLKISLNTNGDGDPNALRSSRNDNSWHRSLKHQTFFSLPRYCKIIRWYERAQERVWKKYGVYTGSSAEIKRAYRSKGLLGYKVWIDGFNNTFDTFDESMCPVTADKKSQLDQTDRYSSYSTEEREKIIKMKTHMKQSGVDEQQRSKSALPITFQKSRHSPVLAQHALLGTKIQQIGFAPTTSSELSKDIASSSNCSYSQDPSSFIAATERSMHIGKRQSATAKLISLKPNENQRGRNRKNKPMSATICKTVDYNPEAHEQQKITAKHHLLPTIKQSFTDSVEKSTTETRPPSAKPTLNMILNIDSHKPYSNHQTRNSLGPIQFRSDINIQQTTIKTYERHANASIRETAANCLQDAGFFKRKSWLKQVEISQEMIKQRTRRLFQRADDRKNNSVLMPMRVISATPSCTTRLSTVKAN